MANTYCPRCKELTKKGGYKAWQIIVSICFFPFGLIALDADGKATTCEKCGYTCRHKTIKSIYMKTILVVMLALASIIYLINPTAGIFELIPDNIPYYWKY